MKNYGPGWWDSFEWNRIKIFLFHSKLSVSLIFIFNILAKKMARMLHYQYEIGITNLSSVWWAHSACRDNAGFPAADLFISLVKTVKWIDLMLVYATINKLAGKPALFNKFVIWDEELWAGLTDSFEWNRIKIFLFHKVIRQSHIHI